MFFGDTGRFCINRIDGEREVGRKRDFTYVGVLFMSPELSLHMYIISSADETGSSILLMERPQVTLQWEEVAVGEK